MWHPSQQFETEPNGSIIFTVHIADLDEIERWLIGFGSETWVLQPQELRKSIVDKCQALTKRSQ